MAKRGGYRVGAGRPRKGEKPPALESVLATALPVSVDVVRKTPLEYMLDVMNDLAADVTRRDRMAIAAATFVHPKAGEAGKKEAKAEAAKTAGVGRFAPAETPAALRLAH